MSAQSSRHGGSMRVQTFKTGQADHRIAELFKP
jgi:hypothetical protein